MKCALGHYQEVTRSATATLLLNAIACSEPNATHGGRSWIAKSAADWCEGTALTISQYENAARKLRKLRLIVTEQHLFGDDYKKAITHLRLTHQGQGLVSKATGP